MATVITVKGGIVNGAFYIPEPAHTTIVVDWDQLDDGEDDEAFLVTVWNLNDESPMADELVYVLAHMGMEYLTAGDVRRYMTQQDGTFKEVETQ